MLNILYKGLELHYKQGFIRLPGEDNTQSRNFKKILKVSGNLELTGTFYTVILLGYFINSYLEK